MGFYRSFPVTLLMKIPFSYIFFGANQSIKTVIHRRYKKSIITHFTAGFFSAVIASAMTIPFDVVKTFM